MVAICGGLVLRSFKVGVLLSMGTVALPAFADQAWVGEIRVFGQNFCPSGWVNAQGGLLAIDENDALFSLMGTTYGGDGVSTFGVVDTRGRSMVHTGQGPGLSPRSMGEMGGQTSVTLSQGNMPAHSHAVNANNLDGDKPGPGNKLLAAAPPSGVGSETIYSDQPANVALAASMIGSAGGSQPVSVVDPYLALTACISLFGIYPSRP